MLEAWKDLEQEVFGPLYDKLWQDFYAQFQFRPGMAPSSWPCIAEPTPSVTYSLKSLYSDESQVTHLMDDIQRKVLQAFRRCVPEGDYLYALDWQHPGYLFYPHLVSDPTATAELKIPFFPYGDYYIFLARDFSFGMVGHPWEETICVFGEQLLKEVEKDIPLTFSELRRK